jgi:hypothetical protein
MIDLRLKQVGVTTDWKLQKNCDCVRKRFNDDVSCPDLLAETIRSMIQLRSE